MTCPEYIPTFLEPYRTQLDRGKYHSASAKKVNAMAVETEPQMRNALTPPDTKNIGGSPVQSPTAGKESAHPSEPLLTSSLELAQHIARNAGVATVMPVSKLRPKQKTPTPVSSDPIESISRQMRVLPIQSASHSGDQASLAAVAADTTPPTNQRSPSGADPNPSDPTVSADANVTQTQSANQLQGKSSTHPTSSSESIEMEGPTLSPPQKMTGSTDTPNSSVEDACSADAGQTTNMGQGPSPVCSESESMFAKRDISQVAHTHHPMSALSSFSSRASLCRHTRHGAPNPLPASQHQHNGRGTSRLESNVEPSILGTSCSNCSCPSPPSSPPAQPNDRARIRTPASAVSSRRNSVVIGERIPFESMTTSSGPSRNSPADSVLPRVNHERAGLNYAPARLQLPAEIEQINVHSTQSAPPTAQNSPPHTPRSCCGSTTSLQLHRDDYRRPMRPALDDLSRAAPNRSATPPLKQLRGRKAPLYIPAVLRPTDANAYTASNSSSMIRHAGQSMQPPPRDHWVPDSARTNCASCMAPFTLLGRRHHCRKCGEIFCSRDSRFVVALNQSLQFNIFGYPSRSCAGCSAAFTKHVLENSRLSSEPSQPSLPQGAPQTIAATRGNRQENNEILAGSLANMPVDWNWSTF